MTDLVLAVAVFAVALPIAAWAGVRQGRSRAADIIQHAEVESGYRDDGSEYGRLLAWRDRLIGEGVDPSDLLVPVAPMREETE